MYSSYLEYVSLESEYVCVLMLATVPQTYSLPQGLGTDDRALIRIMVSRSEVDLFNIRKEFKETHDASLHEFIQVETMIVSPSLCLTLLAAVLCSHLISVCHSGTFSFLISWPLSACLCVAHPSSVAVVKGYSFLRWSMGLWPLHSCSGIPPVQLPLRVGSVIGW